MKKLMTMLAAVATAFGLYAADSGFISGAGFDTSDSSGYTWTTAGTLAEGVFNSSYWTDTTGLTVVEGTSVADDSDNRPAKYYDDTSRNYNGYLNVATTLGNPVGQYVNANGDVQMIDSGLYFDALVKPTVFDEMPDVTAYENAKVGVFVYQADENADKKLFVWAAGSETNFWETTTEIDDTQWYRLTIKMIADIGTGKPGYVVFINGDQVRSDNSISGTLKPEAAVWNATGSLFEGLTDSTEVSEVLFDGKGDVDEIAFTTNPPEFAEDAQFFTFNWADGVTKITCDALGFSTNGLTGAGSVSVINESKATITKTDIDADCAAEDKMIDEITVAADGESAAITVKGAGAVVTINGVPTKYATFAAAIAELNLAEDDTTAALKLTANSTDAIELDNEYVTLTLDLAGKTITGDEDEDVIVLKTGEMTVTNSTDTVGRIIATGTNGSAVKSADSGTLWITAGIFDGEVIGDDECLYITDGKFLASANEPEDLEKFKVAGETRSFLKDGDYLVLGTAVAEIEGKGKFTSLAAAVAAADADDVITVIANINDVDITVSKKITISASDFTLTGKAATYAVKIVDGGDLTVAGGTYQTDAEATQSLFLVGNDASVEGGTDATGKLTISSGTFGGAKAGNLVKVSKGSLDLTGGIFNVTGSRGIKADGPSATVNVDGVQINANGKVAFAADNGGQITIDGGATIGTVQLEGSNDASMIKILDGTIDGEILRKDGTAAGTITIPGTSKATFDRDQTAFCAEGYKTKIVDPATRYSVVAIQYATLTIMPAGEGVETLSVTNSAGEAVNSGDKFDVDDAETVAAVYTLTDGYELDEANSTLEATMTAPATIKVVAKKTQTEPIPVPVDDPVAVSNALDEVGIPAGNPLYATVTTAADVAALNAFLKENSVTDAKTGLTTDQKAYLNDSFLMKDVIGTLLADEAKIEITEVSTTGFSLAIKVGANPATIKTTAADFLKGKVVAGAALDNMTSISPEQVMVESIDTAAGTASFTLTYGDATSGFLKVVVTK